MTKLIVAFSNSANAKGSVITHSPYPLDYFNGNPLSLPANAKGICGGQSGAVSGFLPDGAPISDPEDGQLTGFMQTILSEVENKRTGERTFRVGKKLYALPTY